MSIRVDRQAEYQITLGESLRQASSGFSSLKCSSLSLPLPPSLPLLPLSLSLLPLSFLLSFSLSLAGVNVNFVSPFFGQKKKTDNHKPPTIQDNPSAPRLTQAASGYNLSFVPPAQKEGKTAPREVVYSATTSTPSQKAQHFLLFDNATRKFTLERLDAAFVFNAEVYTKLHPALKVDDADGPGESSAGSGSEEDDDEAAAATGGVYDYRQFLGRTSAAEEKRQKRLGALKRAGKEVVDIPEPVEDAGRDEGEIMMPDAMLPLEEDSDLDAPGEIDDEVLEPPPPPPQQQPPPPPPPPSPPPPPPPPPQPAPATATTTKKKPGPKPKAKAPPKPRAPPKKKAPAPPPPPPPPPVDEIVLPDPEPEVNSDEEDVEFSDEDEDGPPPAVASAAAASATEEAGEPALDFDFEKELDEALDGGDDHTSKAPPPVGLSLVVEEEDSSDEDDDQPRPPPIVAGGGAPKSLRELYGGAPEEDEEEDSESEEE